MLEQLRNYAKGKIATVLLSLLILSFGIWGVGDILRSHGDPPAARVEGRAISGAELEQSFQRAVEQIRQRGNQDFDAEQARNLGVDRQVLAGLIEARAFDQAAADLGVTAPDPVVADAIESIDAFKGATGSFDRATFQATLRAAHYSEDSFTALMRSNITRVNLLRSLVGGLTVPKALLGPLVTFTNERRTVRYVVLPLEQAAAPVPVSDPEIEKQYAANKERYMAPEYRRLTFVDIDPAALAKTITVKEEDIAARYAQHRADYSLPEKRTLEQLIFQDEAKARAAAAALKTGQSFTDLAKAEGKSPDDIALGEKTKTALSPKLADAVFAAPAGGIAGPVEGDFGWTLIHVVKVTPAAEKSLAEMHNQISADLTKEQADAAANELGNKLDKARDNGTPIEAAAKSVGLEAVTIEAVDAAGRDPKGQPIPALAGKDAIVADAFKTLAGSEPDLAQTPEGEIHVVRVDSITRPALRPLSDVKEEIRKGLEAEKQEAALRERAAALAARGNAGESLDSLGTSIGNAPRKSDPLRRDAQSEVFSAEAIKAIFRAPQGGFIAAPVHTGAGVIVAQIDTIQAPSQEEIDAAFANVEEKYKVSESLGNELAALYSSTLRARYKVEINEDAVKRALGGV
jgi:peptidyl-prolyl cis-trans isomerase D